MDIMTVKRTVRAGEKTKLFHEETKLAIWVGTRDSHIGRDGWQASAGDLNTTREDFEALIELANAAIKELDNVRNKEIERLEAELKRLKEEDA